MYALITILIFTTPNWADSQKESPLGKKKALPLWAKENKTPPKAGILWPLASLMVLFLGLLYLTKKFALSQKEALPQELSILSELSLGGQKKLLLVQAREKSFVLAITREKVDLITELENRPLKVQETNLWEMEARP